MATEQKAENKSALDAFGLPAVKAGSFGPKYELKVVDAKQPQLLQGLASILLKENIGEIIAKGCLNLDTAFGASKDKIVTAWKPNIEKVTKTPYCARSLFVVGVKIAPKSQKLEKGVWGKTAKGSFYLFGTYYCYRNDKCYPDDLKELLAQASVVPNADLDDIVNKYFNENCKDGFPTVEVSLYMDEATKDRLMAALPSFTNAEGTGWDLAQAVLGIVAYELKVGKDSKDPTKPSFGLNVDDFFICKPPK